MNSVIENSPVLKFSIISHFTGARKKTVIGHGAEKDLEDLK